MAAAGPRDRGAGTRTYAMNGRSIPPTAHGPWPAPAKLYLMLRVVGRRADGYHLLQTVFQFVALHDEFYFDVPVVAAAEKSAGSSTQGW